MVSDYYSETDTEEEFERHARLEEQRQRQAYFDEEDPNIPTYEEL